LQLEDVRDVGIAVVTLNGKEKGTVWAKPFRIDLGAGDEISPGDRRFTSTNAVLQGGAYTSKIRLEPSGLIGPVIIMIYNL
jgi:hypothetical protein